MLKLRDISLKHRILMTNILMIALPVGFLLLLGGLLEPSERAALARVVALLTLLEGHAEAVLDAVDPRQYL